MLTILNIINYLVGKPLSLYVLILATIIVYYYVLSNYWETCYNNKIYLIIITILLLIDITMIIIIFTISHDYDNETINSDEKIIIKKSKKNKNKKKKEKIQLEDEKNKVIPLETNIVVNTITQVNPDNKSIISLYNPEADVSLKTYN
jgi:hypothetical protein